LEQQEPFAIARAICNSKSHLQQHSPCTAASAMRSNTRHVKD
jgi:hypothetical protein